MAAVHVLFVEDDDVIREATTLALERDGFRVTAAPDGLTGLDAFRGRRPDLALLDVMLPGLDGVSLCRRIRDESTVPVIMVSARADAIDVVLGLEAGADDYVTKPFGMDELLARLRAAVRRATPTGPEDDASAVVTESFTVDLAARKVHRDGADVRLTPTEWHLLEVLVRNPGRLVSQKQLLREVWGPAYGTESNYLRVYMAQLRRKLESDPARPRHFITEPGMGYRFEA